MEWILKQWITNLTVVAILGALVHIILPNSHFKKYISFLFGLILLVIVMQPLLQLLGQIQTTDKLIFQNIIKTDMEAFNNQGSYIESTQQEQLRGLFQANLEKTIALQVERGTGVVNVAASVTLRSEKGSSMVTGIEKIVITAESEDKIVYIEPVYISVSSELSIKNDKKFDPSKSLEIKKYLSNLYELDQDSIHVYHR